MNIPDVLISQFQSALEMLKQTVTRCPDSLWNAPGGNAKFWHVAYHALFYTHLYLQDSEKDFTAWDRHRQDYQFLGPTPWPPHAMPQIGEPYNRETVLEYLAFCQGEVGERVPGQNLEASSGFEWLSFGKLELQFYNIRHLQQHTGELMERLGSLAGVEIDWVGTKHSNDTG